MADDKVKSRKISTFSSDYSWVTESLAAEEVEVTLWKMFTKMMKNYLIF